MLGWPETPASNPTFAASVAAALNRAIVARIVAPCSAAGRSCRMTYAPRSTVTTQIEETAELAQDRALPLADRLLADPQARPDLGLRLPPPVESIDELSLGFN